MKQKWSSTPERGFSNGERTPFNIWQKGDLFPSKDPAGLFGTDPASKRNRFQFQNYNWWNFSHKHWHRAREPFFSKWSNPMKYSDSGHQQAVNHHYTIHISPSNLFSLSLLTWYFRWVFQHIIQQGYIGMVVELWNCVFRNFNDLAQFEALKVNLSPQSEELKGLWSKYLPSPLWNSSLSNTESVYHRVPEECNGRFRKQISLIRVYNA